MNRGMIAGIIILSTVGICCAETNAPLNIVPSTMYPESVQIKADDGKLMANIDVNGKVTIAPEFSIDSVINTLIIRMIIQNKNFLEQMQSVNKAFEDAKMRASVTSQKALEIIQMWNPPPPPETPKETKPVEKKKGFFSKLFGGK
jgi:hypothetical protein